MRRSVFWAVLSLPIVAFATACRQQTPQATRAGDSLSAGLGARLPTGVQLDPAAPQATVGPMPLTMASAPEGDRIVLSLSGYREQGMQVVERASGRVLQDTAAARRRSSASRSPPTAARCIRRAATRTSSIDYDWRGGARDAARQHRAGVKPPRAKDVDIPPALALSPDGRTLYVAENLADSLAVVDIAARRGACSDSPPGVIRTTSSSTPQGTRVRLDVGRQHRLRRSRRMRTAACDRTARIRRRRAIRRRSRSNADGSRLFVASRQHGSRRGRRHARRERVIGELLDPPPAGPAKAARRTRSRSRATERGCSSRKRTRTRWPCSISRAATPASRRRDGQRPARGPHPDRLVSDAPCCASATRCSSPAARGAARDPIRDGPQPAVRRAPGDRRELYARRSSSGG